MVCRLGYSIIDARSVVCRLGYSIIDVRSVVCRLGYSIIIQELIRIHFINRVIMSGSGLPGGFHFFVCVCVTLMGNIWGGAKSFWGDPPQKN